MKKTEVASPELNKFFENLAELKKYIEERMIILSDRIQDDSASAHDEIELIYEKLDKTFKVKIDETENG